MAGVFDGFATIVALIALGSLLAHLRVIDAAGQRTLSTLAFFVASPALLLTVLEDSDLGAVFSDNLVAIAAAVVVSATLSAAVSLARRHGLGESVVGTLCSSYQNSANLGIPIAAYVLGDAALVAPLLLLQLLVLQPLALTLLDVAASEEGLRLDRVLARPVRNPITIGSLLGLALAATGADLPPAVQDPLALLGGMAVPAMLLAYGVSLRLGPLPGRGVPAVDLATTVALKMVVQPLAAYAVGRFALGLEGDALLAVTVLSALPTAQNVFIIASRYDRAVLLARDAILVSTIASVPVIVAITTLVA
ncbi:AEC family transporter [Nocardioides sp.]|uniref:AEC family transporter n=1 Tax=Nocardioides sp. TaxID=35761 RepID=UPI0025D230E3|nr:AEC family transporter [Nocardioides sp.]